MSKAPPAVRVGAQEDVLQARGGKLEIIQALRGLAALAVVFWHASRYFAPYGTGWAGQAFQPGGSMGVDLFFLISGFIMVATTIRSDGSVRYVGRFLAKRFMRVWPLYACATMLFAIAIPGRRASVTEGDGPLHLFASLIFWPRNGAGDAAPAFDHPVLPVGWTLNYEMYFYVIFAASMLFGRLRWIAFTTILAATLVGVPYIAGQGANLSLNPGMDYGLDGALGLITSPLILMFGVGCMIGLIYQSPAIIKNVFILNLILFASVSAVIYQYTAGFRCEHGILRSGLTLIPMMLFMCLATKTIDFRVPRSLVYLGDISFSLYVFHPFVQEGFDHLVQSNGGATPSGFPAFFITTALSIVVAAASHRYLETGLRQRVRASTPGRRQEITGALPQQQ